MGNLARFWHKIIQTYSSGYAVRNFSKLCSNIEDNSLIKNYLGEIFKTFLGQFGNIGSNLAQNYGSLYLRISSKVFLSNLKMIGDNK